MIHQPCHCLPRTLFAGAVAQAKGSQGSLPLCSLCFVRQGPTRITSPRRPLARHPSLHHDSPLPPPKGSTARSGGCGRVTAAARMRFVLGCSLTRRRKPRRLVCTGVPTHPQVATIPTKEQTWPLLKSDQAHHHNRTVAVTKISAALPVPDPDTNSFVPPEQ